MCVVLLSSWAVVIYWQSKGQTADGKFLNPAGDRALEKSGQFNFGSEADFFKSNF